MAERLPTVGGDSGAWGTVLNGFLGVAHNADGTLKPVAFTSGGTGANYANALAMAQGVNLALWKAGADIASASTIAVPNPLDGNLFTITGNTTVNGIATAGVTDGTVIYLRIASNPQFVHSNNMQLMGAVNHTFSGGETLTFQIAGGQWREIHRSYGTGGAAPSQFWRGDGVWANPGAVGGAQLANSAGDPVNDIDITVGARYSDDATFANRSYMSLTSAYTKQLDAAWAVGSNAGGRDTGAIADGTWHVFLIMRPDTGVVDVLFSASATAPTMPTNYTKKWRIGSIVRSAGSIKSFVQDGAYFQWSAQVVDVSSVNPGTSAVTRTLTVPTGIKVIAELYMSATTTTGATTVYMRASDLAITDEAPTTSGYQAWASAAVSTQNGGAMVRCRTNTSAQIRTRISFSDANVTFLGATTGWWDYAAMGTI